MQEKEQTVQRIRAFTRFYLSKLDLLNHHYLGSEYSPTEARVLFEVFRKDGCNAAYIAKLMNLDKSYLSRIIRAHEKNGFLVRTTSKTDSRSMELHLTQMGFNKAEQLVKKSNEQVGALLTQLSSKDCEALVEALDTITQILDGQESLETKTCEEDNR